MTEEVAEPVEETAMTQHRRTVRAQEVRQALDIIYLSQLKTISLVMAVYYLLLSIAHAFVLPAEIKGALVSLAFVTGLMSVGLYFLLGRSLVPARYSHAAFLPQALAGIALVFVHVELTGDILQLTNGVLIMIAFGFITLAPWAYGLLIGLSTLFFALCLVSLNGPMMPHMAFLGVATLVLSMLCFTQRYRTLSNIERLLISNRSKSRALAGKAREARQLMLEATAAAEQARRANEAKGMFLANASHELRTPLTGVLGMMRLLEKSALDSGQQELLGAAKFSAKTLLTLINDILDLARMEEGKLELKPGPIVPEEIASQVAELLRPTATEKGLSLSFDADKEVSNLCLLGDGVRLGQILFNLVGNAIKFTDAGEVSLSLTCENQKADQATIRFDVQDTGIGMKPSEVGRLFQRFEQADSSSVKSQGGAGLGLAICQELAQLMKGRIEAESTPGKGSLFRFAVSLPLAEAQEPPEVVGGEEVSVDVETLPLKVLLAEDNAVNRMLVSKLLAPYPWQITTAENGADAVTEACSGDFDLILMDVRMPQLDGVEATRRITQELGNDARPYIIALTANTMADDIETYLAAGMDDVVGKPIQMTELKAALQKMVEKRCD